MAVDNYLKAFRSKDGISLDDTVFIITGDVAPTDASVPTALPIGTIYINSTTGTAYVKSYQTAGWVAIEGAFRHGGMSSATVGPYVTRYTFTSAANGTSYFLSVKVPLSVEFSGVNGAIFRNSSTGTRSTVPVLRQGGTAYTTSWLAATPAWVQLLPGEFIVKPSAAGTVYMDIYGYANFSPALVGTSQTAAAGVSTPAFDWSATFIAAQSQ